MFDESLKLARTLVGIFQEPENLGGPKTAGTTALKLSESLGKELLENSEFLRLDHPDSSLPPVPLKVERGAIVLEVLAALNHWQGAMNGDITAARELDKFLKQMLGRHTALFVEQLEREE